MAWANKVYGKPCASISDSGGADPPKSVSEKQAWAPLDAQQSPLPEPPPMFQRDKEAEATAKKADVYVRFMAKRC